MAYKRVLYQNSIVSLHFTKIDHHLKTFSNKSLPISKKKIISGVKPKKGDLVHLFSYRYYNEIILISGYCVINCLLDWLSFAEVPKSASFRMKGLKWLWRLAIKTIACCNGLQSRITRVRITPSALIPSSNTISTNKSKMLA